MKKVVALLLALVLVLAMAACGQAPAADEPAAASIKIGAILIHDENSGYDMAHIEGITKACEALGISVEENVTFKYNIPEDESAYDALPTWLTTAATSSSPTPTATRPTWSWQPPSSPTPSLWPAPATWPLSPAWTI